MERCTCTVPKRWLPRKERIWGAPRVIGLGLGLVLGSRGGVIRVGVRARGVV